MLRKLSTFMVVAALGLLPAATAAAQSGAGSLSGIIRDSSGAEVPGTTVQVVNETTGSKTETVTDSAGAFSLATLTPGRYRLEATLDGFEPGVRQLPGELRGAVWTLTSDDGGHRLTGTWGDKRLPIGLQFFGSRPVDMQPPFAPFYLADLPYEIVEGKVELTPDNRPYEYLKSNSVDPVSGEDITENGVTCRFPASS